MGMRRSASLMKTMNRTSAAMITVTIAAIHHFMDSMVIRVSGRLEMMLANRIMEMPLPIPNSVICSPIHITTEEPAVNARTITRPGRKPAPSAPSRPEFLTMV